LLFQVNIVTKLHEVPHFFADDKDDSHLKSDIF
jgi:hypothetical protein